MILQDQITLRIHAEIDHRNVVFVMAGKRCIHQKGAFRDRAEAIKWLADSWSLKPKDDA